MLSNATTVVTDKLPEGGCQQPGSDGSPSGTKTTSQKTRSTGGRASDAPSFRRRHGSIAAPRVPANWQHVPGVCNPFDSASRSSKSRRLQHIELLLSEGTLAAGQLVVYKNRAGKVLAEGHIRYGGFCEALIW